jgi:SpoVK/Ycf46/Vps4 family AAA+-type ATPase
VDCLKVAISRNSKSSEGLTMADLLNVIDGIGTSEDRVLFMTANHPEVLDAALTRAGRVDRNFHIDSPGMRSCRDSMPASLNTTLCSLGQNSGPRCRNGHDCRRSSARFSKRER